MCFSYLRCITLECLELRIIEWPTIKDWDPAEVGLAPIIALKKYAQRDVESFSHFTRVVEALLTLRHLKIETAA